MEPEYVAARTVLLDAIEALTVHHAALVVVGAQAIYLRTGSAGLQVAPFTTDGDVALNPTLLADDPLIEAAMERRGFRLKQVPDRNGVEPGTWLGTAVVAGRTYSIPVDLIVPEAVLAGGNTRGARLPVHGKRAAKRARGLEAALVDHDRLLVGGLADGDDREVQIAVAGAAALLVAKVWKLQDRVAEGRAHRLDDKDAADVLRLVRATPVTALVDRLAILRDSDIAGPVTRSAISGFVQLFRAQRSPGVVMAARAVALDLPAPIVEAQLNLYARELQRLL